MSDMQTQIDALRAQLDELLAVPRIRQYLDAHRSRVAEIEAAARHAEERKRADDARAAAARRSVEANLLLRVRINELAQLNGPPVSYIDVPLQPTRGVNGGKAFRVDGPRFVIARPGHAVRWVGEPAPVQHHFKRSTWERMLEMSPERRDHVQAGHLDVVPVDVEHTLRDRRLLAEHYA